MFTDKYAREALTRVQEALGEMDEALGEMDVRLSMIESNIKFPIDETQLRRFVVTQRSGEEFIIKAARIWRPDSSDTYYFYAEDKIVASIGNVSSVIDERILE